MKIRDVKFQPERSMLTLSFWSLEYFSRRCSLEIEKIINIAAHIYR